MADARVPMSAVMSAFGVPAVVTRPAPDDTPIETSVTWVTPLTDEIPLGMENQRKQRRRVLALNRDEVPTCPRETVISAPERLGEAAQTWIVDTLEGSDPDQFRAVVRPS